MPTVTLNRAVFEKLVGKKLPPEQLKERISMLGTDLEKIEGDEIHVEIFPNRPDMLSEQGFARAFSSFIGLKTGLRNYTIKKSGMQVIVDKSVTMRPYSVCAIVKNVMFTDERIREVMQIQEKLAKTHGRDRKKSCYGLYPLGAVEFPVTYVAKDPANVIFQPLGFNEMMSAVKVEELHPKGKEYKWIAQGWKKYPFYVDHKGRVLSMLPYTNSHDTGKIDETTRDVFIECTGTDLFNVQIALNIFVTMLADMGGEIYTIEMVYPDRKLITPDLTPHEMALDINYVNKRLGLSLTDAEVKKHLEQMGYGYDARNVLVPAYRADILHPIDLVEDIAVAYGFENFTEQIPQVATIAQENPLQRFISKLRDVLVGAGMQEIRTFHLYSKDELRTKMNARYDCVPLKNAPADYDHLRNSLVPGLLKTLTSNQHHDYPHLLFEIGTVFVPDANAEDGVQEKTMLGIAICHDKADFTSIRQVVDLIARLLVLNLNMNEAEHASFISGRVALGNVGESFALFGELHPKVLTAWNLPMPTAVAEIDVEVLFGMVKKDI